MLAISQFAFHVLRELAPEVGHRFLRLFQSTAGHKPARAVGGKRYQIGNLISDSIHFIMFT